MKKLKKIATKSLYLELWLSLVFSFIVGGIIYLLLQEVNYQIYTSKWSAKEYAEKQLEKSIENFQSYVTENEISSDEPLQIQIWSEANPFVYFYIEKDGKAVYNFLVDYTEPESDYALTDEELEMSYGYNPYAKQYTITFADGDCIMHVFDDFQADLYNKIQNVNFFISAAVVIILITILVQKKIHYINNVTKGINILEGGDLNYNIPVKGNDEIAHVAESLNSMRIALSQQMENEKKALQANNSLVTALSHDLRTPLTTQMGYLEILKEHHYNSPEEMDKYLSSALATCNQIKEMSDRLFEYFLAFDPNPMRPADTLEEYDGMEFFMQIISELTPPLMEAGFRFNVTEAESSFNIKVNADDVLRIFNNVFTNLDKYAAEDEPVDITIRSDKENAFISFTNKIRNTPRKNESAKIGLISISSLMKRQGGSSLTRTSNDTFTIELKFPVYEHSPAILSAK